MWQGERNSSRAGRSIDNLDDRRLGTADPGAGDPHGNRMPDYKTDILQDEQNAALDRVPVSGIADVAPEDEIGGKGDSGGPNRGKD